MPIEAVLAALTAAVLHAGWNAMVKRGGGDPLLDIALIWGACGVVGLLALPFVELPRTEAFYFLAATMCIHLPYGLTLAAAYRAGSLSHVYTIARGTPPMLIAAVTAIMGETLAPGQYVGVAILSLGILVTGLAPHAPLRATLLALCVAVTIVGYSVMDGLGTRASGAPVGYAVWFFIVLAVAFVSLVAALRGPDKLIVFARANWRRAVIGGPASALSYGLVLWAMSFAPVAGVSALRETSVAVAVFIGWAFLHEPMSKRRIAGVVLVALGASLLKLG